VVGKLGLPVDAVMTSAQSDAIKTRLREQTAEAQRRRIFGAPSFTTDDGELFWGNDRLEQALAWAKRAADLRR
jgi:2-hydroxychromene-2-carboxylate isomerase